MRYVADAYCPEKPPYQNEADAYCFKETSIPNMNSIRYETKKLSRFQSGCHGNLVTIAIQLMPIIPTNLHSKCKLSMILIQRSY